MRWTEITEAARKQGMSEGAVTLPHGQRIIVMRNPPPEALVRAVQRSAAKLLRGLVFETNVYWWDGHNAIHGDIAHVIGHGEYTDDRLELRWTHNEARVAYDDIPWPFERWQAHPVLRRLSASALLFFYSGSMGWLDGPEWVEVEKAEALHEAFETIKVLGKTVSVIRNPSKAELRAATLRKTMRGLVEPQTGDTFWWPASQAIHASAARALGLSDDIYTNDGISRLEMRGSKLDLISGLDTAFASRSLRYLTTGGEILFDGRWSFDDFKARQERYVAWHADAIEKHARGEKPSSFSDA